MEFAGKGAEASFGGLIPPASMPAVQRTELAIDQIEGAICRGGGALELPVRKAVREFAERVISAYDGAEFARILSAATLAGELHAPQERRLDGIPFVVHPFEVALTLYETLQVRDSASICAALLHDTVEDQASRLAALSDGRVRSWPGRVGEKAEALNVIKDSFEQKVAALVDRLTNGEFGEMARVAAEAGNVAPERYPTHRYYREHIVELYNGAQRIDQEAFTVKMADFLRNLWGLEGLRALHLDQVIRKLEDKRSGLSVMVRDTIENIAESHPLFPVRQRVATLLGEAVKAMASVGDFGARTSSSVQIADEDVRTPGNKD